MTLFALVSIMLTMDAFIQMTVMARATSKIGFVSTASTTFREPYNPARNLGTLEAISGGRIARNAVTSSDEPSAANFGASIVGRDTR